VSITPGDLPDWSSQITPAFQNLSVNNQLSNVTTQLISSSVPFRIWGMWLTLSIASNAAWNAAGQYSGCRLIDGSGAILLNAAASVTRTQDHAEVAVALSLNGYKPLVQSSFYTVNFVTDTVPVNVFMHGSGGLFVSQP
jgi:hypothetical protein